MTITERTLKRWRKEALEAKKALTTYKTQAEGEETKLQWAERILRLTQELLDQHLLRK